MNRIVPRWWWITLMAIQPGCTSPQVIAFDVPPMACPGQEVVVKWQVEGPAELRAERDPSDWDEEAVLSRGSRKLVLATSTKFTITAVNANPANGRRTGTKEVTIPKLAEDRRVTTSCNRTTRKCTGTFTLDTENGPMRVTRLSEPKVTQSGKTRPTTLCVTHDELSRTCVSPDAPAIVDVPAAGPWTIEAALVAGARLEPPPAYTLQLDFACR